MDTDEERLKLRTVPSTHADASFVLLYLGRRGAMSRFALDAMSVVASVPGLQGSICISRQNENFSSYLEFGQDLIGVDTFHTYSGALFSAWRIPILSRRLVAEIVKRRATTVIDLMPHVWSSILARSIHKAGARYFAIAHDAQPHPGDATGLVTRITDRALARADIVIALSQSVAKILRAKEKIEERRLVTLFHPILSYGSVGMFEPRRVHRPLRVLFFGRIMPYKGLSLFVDMLEILQARGKQVEAGVFGEGELGLEKTRLAAVGAEIVNHWLSEDEIAEMFGRYDLVIVSHIEASQSGIIAAAFGAGLPVVVTPIGGLPEQVTHNVNGMVATEISAQALAESVEQIATEPGLYEVLSLGVREQLKERSMQRFVQELVKLATIRT